MSISSELTAISKIVYPKGLPHAFYSMNPAIGDVKKVTNAGGEKYSFSVAYSQGAVGSADYNTAYTVAGNQRYGRFEVTRVTDYALARMNGEDFEALADDYTAIVSAWKDRVEGAYHEAMRSAAIQLFRSGTGARGTISSGSTVASTSITLSNISEVTNFYVGMYVQGSQTDGGSLRDSGASIALTGVNRATGALTTGTNWSTTISGLTAGDTLYRRGDAKNGSTAVTFTGWDAWIDSAAGALWGLTRTVDSVALAGTVQDYASVPMDEALLDLAQRVSIQGTSAKVAYVNPRDKVQVVKLLEAKARFVRPQQGADAKFGFDGITFDSDSGPIELKGDINCPRYKVFLMSKEHCEMASVGPMAKPLKQDGQLVRARDAYDAYEMRIGTYGNFAVRAPYECGKATSWGQ